MNRANDIIAYLSRAEESQILVLAPHAPPIDRTAEGIKIALNQVLDASDINDTLAALSNRAPSGPATTIGSAGTFSFGVRGVGRFRVTYVTQRGSKIVGIYRIPVTIPKLEAVIQDAQLAKILEHHARSKNGGLLIVNGPNAVKNSLVVYALLQRVNETERRLIYCIERALTHLMNHDNSVVIQSEMQIDVAGVEEGVKMALLFAPDILFVGDLRSNDSLAAVMEAIESNVFTILSSVSLNHDALLNRLATHAVTPPDFLGKRLRGVLTVIPQTSGQVQVQMTNVP
ncbi:MAG: ATPase, T2SS/T4P/T4SS family [Kiritimatiellae bacterium]|nr:ATPase, T2SS/T4P/T4SS family [Kiritimatiellia bacterium]